MQTNGEIFFLKSCLNDCKIVFDVGANRGDWTRSALEMKSRITVHCFEPIREMFTLLKGNNFPSNVYCNNFGLSSKKGQMEIYLKVQSVYLRKGLNAGWGIKTPGQTEVIEMITLDEYCIQNKIETIDFLKCDVEGHEFHVFQGAMKMIREGRIKRIQFEYGGCNIDARVLLMDIFDQFEGLGYTFFRIMPRKIIKIEEYDQRLENFVHKNFAILHNTLIA
jgi:FkbM family methyltransferase